MSNLLDIPLNSHVLVKAGETTKELVVVERLGCDHCALANCGVCRQMACSIDRRFDGRSVQFVEVQNSDDMLRIQYDGDWDDAKGLGGKRGAE